MSSPDFVILYVSDTSASAAFYTRLLERKPLDQSPNFAMFKLDSGVMLGLWSRAEVEPALPSIGVGGELAFTVRNAAEVDNWHQRWRDQGLPIAQAPTAMDFGHTFVALDPDGHRLRVFAPA